MSYETNDKMEYYLVHHGIEGQKWGVRRYQNPDGSLTIEGKKRYSNSDSDSLAELEAAKARKMLEFYDKKRAAQKKIASDPKNFNQSKEKEEYANALATVQDLFKRSNAMQQLLKTKYKDVKFDYYVEGKTGEQFVRTVLTSEDGNVYVSEIYSGTRLNEKDRKKVKVDTLLG